MSRNDELPIADTEVHYLSSAAVGDEFKIFVGHCGDEDADAPVPVLYLTDANGSFGSAVEAVRNLQLPAHLPPMLVVGIGYRAGGLADTFRQRTRDLTPTVDAGFAERQPRQALTGGAPALLAFIRDELKPWVADRFSVDPSDATYSGYSFGGLFGAYTLLTEPSTFQRYVLGSPSLWWHDEAMFQLEASYAKEHDDLAASVFVGIGALETHEGRLREAARQPAEAQAAAAARYLDMVDDVERFVTALRGRGYPGLSLESAVFPDEFHVTVPQLNLTRGLRLVFDAPR